MGRISRRRIDPEIEERVNEIFINYLAELNTRPAIKEFIQSLLTHTEQIMIAKRLAIALLLTKGFNYQEIDDTLKVSKSTVSGVDKELQSGATGYIKAVKKIMKDEKLERMWNKLEELSLEFSLPKRYGSETWKRKSNKGKEVNKRKRQLEKV
jgi:uncharacterized protein YerC